MTGGIYSQILDLSMVEEFWARFLYNPKHVFHYAYSPFIKANAGKITDYLGD